jgi:DNA repair ATPase RecN
MKCELPGCSNFDLKESTIACNGICKKDFHGTCIGLPRQWKQSSLQNKISSNFICDNCKTVTDILSKIIDDQTAKHNMIMEKLNEYKAMTNKIINDNKKEFMHLTESHSFYENEFKNLESAVHGMQKFLKKMDYDPSELEKSRKISEEIFDKLSILCDPSELEKSKKTSEKIIDKLSILCDDVNELSDKLEKHMKHLLMFLIHIKNQRKS